MIPGMKCHFRACCSAQLLMLYFLLLYQNAGMFHRSDIQPAIVNATREIALLFILAVQNRTMPTTTRAWRWVYLDYFPIACTPTKAKDKKTLIWKSHVFNVQLLDIKKSRQIKGIYKPICLCYLSLFWNNFVSSLSFHQFNLCTDPFGLFWLFLLLTMKVWLLTTHCLLGILTACLQGNSLATCCDYPCLPLDHTLLSPRFCPCTALWGRHLSSNTWRSCLTQCFSSQNITEMEKKQINHFVSQVAYSKVSALTKKDLRIAVNVLAKKNKKEENFIFD